MGVEAYHLIFNLNIIFILVQCLRRKPWTYKSKVYFSFSLSVFLSSTPVISKLFFLGGGYSPKVSVRSDIGTDLARVRGCATLSKMSTFTKFLVEGKSSNFQISDFPKFKSAYIIIGLGGT